MTTTMTTTTTTTMIEGSGRGVRGVCARARARAVCMSAFGVVRVGGALVLREWDKGAVVTCKAMKRWEWPPSGVTSKTCIYG